MMCFSKSPVILVNAWGPLLKKSWGIYIILVEFTNILPAFQKIFEGPCPPPSSAPILCAHVYIYEEATNFQEVFQSRKFKNQIC